jgi:hypothetical protein
MEKMLNTNDSSNSEDESNSQWEDQFSSNDEDSNSDESQRSWDSYSSSDSSNSSISGSKTNESESEDESDDDSLTSNNNENKDGIEANYIFNLKSGIRFRKQNKEIATQNEVSSSTSSGSPRNKRRFRSSKISKQGPKSITSVYKKAIKILLSKKSTTLLLISMLVWLYVQFLIGYHDMRRLSRKESFLEDGSVDIMSMRKRAQRKKSAFEALGQAAAPFFKKSKKKKTPSSRDKNAKGDKLPRGCKAHSWQTYSFPTCNNVHEIDLKNALHMSRRGKVIPADLGEGDKSAHTWSKEDRNVARQMGYLGSGLWRQVWKVDPRISGESSVLKVMKSEHEIDGRNFDRHRRDSLVMERLTSSPNVVSIYGLCGNTVLTEYAGMTLDEYLYEDAEKVDKYDTNTQRGKAQLALEVMKGLEALHEIKDGPIVHADIQAKQFLFDPVEGVKINDFNRCRILPINNSTGEICKLKIPSAPGGNRSPEEYELLKIDEKIDLYSAANVMYGILTGHRPHENKLKNELRKMVMKGKKPEIHKDFRKPGTIEAVLADIVDNAYSLDPKARWSAKKVVEKLESVLENEHKNSVSLRRRQLSRI